MKKILNPAKPVHAWTLDGTKVGVFPNGNEAADALHSYQGKISYAVRNWKILKGKYIVSYGDVFPGVPDFSHKKASAVWAWDTECNPLGKYPSQGRAARALCITPESVRDSIKRRSVISKKYIFTGSDTPPALSAHQLKRLKKIKDAGNPIAGNQDKYELEERKWVSLGEFENMEDASESTGLHARTIHRMAYSGTIWQKNYRAKRKGKLICVERQEWHPAGKFTTIKEVADRVGAVQGTVLHGMNNKGVIGGKYKVSRIMQPIETPTV